MIADDLHLARLAMEGLFEARPWQAFLHALRTRLDAGYANIILRRPGSLSTDLVEWRDCDGDDDHLRPTYFAAFAACDPFPYFTMEPGRSMNLPELIGGTNFRRHSFFQDFLAPNGMDRLLLCRIVEPSGYQAWLSVTRRHADGDFNAADRALCNGLAPHLATALRCFGAFEKARITREVHDRVMRKLDLGSLMIDARRAIVGSDGGAARLLAAGDAVRTDAGGILRLVDCAADRALGATLARIALGEQNPQAIAIDSAPRIDILVVPLSTSAIRQGAPIAAIYLHTPQHPTRGIMTSQSQRLRELFRLSPTEAELALRLADGQTIAEAAVEIAITEQSARTYSKRIFAKTGTTRQADLVRLLLRSVATLA